MVARKILSDRIFRKLSFNPFVPFVSNASFFYPLKTSENLTVFQGLEKECIGNDWVKTLKHYRQKRKKWIIFIIETFTYVDTIT